MARFKITIEYDGTPYSGWQRQNDVPSVQQTIETAIYAFAQETVNLQAAGRTDSGVHARGQVAHFDLTKERSCYQVMEGLNFHLQNAPIVITQCDHVDEHFNARFSATYRRYLYRILLRRAPLALDANRAWQIGWPLDIPAMQDAATYFLGEHDFTSFRATICQADSPVKTLDCFEVVAQGDELFIHAQARSFLHHQVRNLVGTLQAVGAGKITAESIPEIFAAKDRRAAPPTAPACGLYLMEVGY